MRRAAEWAGVVAISLAALLALEGLTRVYVRVRRGYWPRTPAEVRHEQAERFRRIVAPHPFLIAVPRPGGSASLGGKSVTVNSLGYRGPEFARPKPAGTFRVLASGGSTTFDVSVSSDAATWPARLEEALRRRFPGSRIEVVNGGVPGYTSLEMLLKLEMIDFPAVDPDIVLAFVGLNDLQPSAAPGFRPDYTVGHAEIQRRFLGFATPTPGLVSRSVLLHKLALRLFGDREERLSDTPRRAAPLLEAEEVYRERLRAIARLGRERGTPVVFLTQALRFGVGRPASPADSAVALRWLPYLTVDGVVAGMERYNEITREVARDTGVPLVDVARGLALEDADFADYCHWSDVGAAKMAAFVAEGLPDSLFGSAAAPARAAEPAAGRALERPAVGASRAAGSGTPPAALTAR